MTLFHPFVLDNDAGQQTVVGIGSDSEKYGVGISSDFNVTGSVGIGTTIPGKTFVVKGSGGNFVGEITNTGTSVDNNGLFVTTANTNASTILFAVSSGGSEKFRISAAGGIGVGGANYGTNGQVLSSTGSGLNWINPGDANVTSASNVGTNDASSTNSTHYLAFVGATSGNNPLRVDTTLQYNPSINQLKFNDAGSLLIKQSDETDYNWHKGIQVGYDSGAGPSPLLMFAHNNNAYISDRGNELRITSDSSPIRIRTLNYGGDPELGEDIATFNPSHSVDLFYTGTKRFSTSGVGATTFGNLDVTGSISGTNYLISSSNFSLTGGTINNVLVVGGSSVSGGEGGEIQLTMPPTTNLSGTSIILDAQTNAFRVFEQSGNNRGFYLDLTTAANSASGKIWHDGNDGPSSGLNADKLDDVEASSFLRSDTADSATGLITFFSSFNAEAIAKDDITTRTSGGFFETNTATLSEGWPEDSNNWFHLLNSTHSNGSNYYSMQFAGNFFNQNIYHRNTNNSGSQTWSKVWTESTDGPGSGLHADLFDGIDKSGSVTDYSSLTSSSLIMMGNTFGSVFRIYYDNFNQFATMQTGDSSTRNFGNIDIKSGRGGLSQTDNPYYASGGNTGSVTGSSIKISHNSGELVLGCATGNFNLTQASGNHRGFKVYLDGRIDHVTKGAYGMKMVHRGSSSSFKQVVFEETSGTEIGSITINNTANTTSFNETSDYRIKENVVGITSALDKINQLRPINFNFIGKSVKLDGFLAHEVQAVIPYAVSGEKDAVKTVKDGDLSDDGSKEDAERIATLPTKEVPDLQQLDKSKLITLLTASVQELSAKNDALEARIKALESS